MTLAPESVCVVVHTNTQGVFSRLLGIDIWKEDARAIAQASQVTAVGALAAIRRPARARSPTTLRRS